MKSTKPKISQETFDETVLENQEIFDLSPSEAITETLDQFQKQQGISISELQSYLVTSHPESEKGKEERKLRNVFQNYLNVLDDAVLGDGMIDLVDSTTEERVQSWMNALTQIQNFCVYGPTACTTDTNSSTSTSTLQQRVEQSLPYLTLLHSTQSLFTLMSFLGIINIDLHHPVDTIESTALTLRKQLILEKVIPLLITLLTPRHSMEKDIKLQFKDAFVAVIERLVRLINYYHNQIETLENNEHKSHHTTTRTVSSSLKSLLILIRLASAACRNSERNKVAFARAFQNITKNDSIRKRTIPLLIQILSSTYDQYSLLFNHHNSIETNKCTSHDDASNEMTNNSSIRIHLMTQLCQLVSILCRFDDFRSSVSSSGNDGNSNSQDKNSMGIDSSYGMNVSSSHDHVLEFHRDGIVPLIHKITLLALETSQHGQQQTVTDTPMDTSEDIVDYTTNPNDSTLNEEEEPEEEEGEVNNNTENGEADHENNINTTNEDLAKLASAALYTTRVLAVNDDIVQSLVAVGTLRTVKLALERGISSTDTTVSGQYDSRHYKTIQTQKQNLTSGSIGLIRNLCGNDEIKTTLCLGSGSSSHEESTTTTTATITNHQMQNEYHSILPALLHSMQLYRSNALIQEHGCGALAAMALRKPQNALRIIQEDGAKDILNAMKTFSNNVLVQRQGALAIRNIASRLIANPSSGTNSNDDITTASTTATIQENTENAVNIRDVFLDLGAEVILRNITGRHQGSVDEAYAALRDLGCQVSMVKFDQETNETITRTVMFGDVKPQFRPVYEESS